MNTAFSGTPDALSIPLSLRLYGDIIGRERPNHQNDMFSRRHPKMSRVNRAKLFAPFAALEGFEGRVRCKEIPYVPKSELDANETWELNHRLNKLHELTHNGALSRVNRVAVTVEYFEVCSDPESEAFGVKGLYHTVAGIVQRVDHVNQTLYLSDMNTSAAPCRAIAFSDIFGISDPFGMPVSRSNSG